MVETSPPDAAVPGTRGSSPSGERTAKHKFRGRYVYAVLGGHSARSLGPIGLGGGEVYALTEGRIAAAVSDFPEGRIRPERRNLAAHQDVLKTLMKETTVLPMAFGVVADSEAAVRKLLSKNQATFASQLRHVEGKVEMGLRVSWDVPNIFEYFVTTHQELRESRDRLFGKHGEPGQNEKIEVGRLFERLLNEDREANTERVEAILGKAAGEVKPGRCRSEREIMNLACLVPRTSLATFEAAVFEAARLFDDSYSFDYNGPWAPHSFVEVDLKA